MKNFVAIAHDHLKEDLANFLHEKDEWLNVRNAEIIATGRTAELLEKKGVSRITHLSPGKSGGYNQITQMVLEGKIDLVIFLRDIKVREPHHEDIQALLDTCDKLNIPVATNMASAELLILGLIKKEALERAQRNFSKKN